ncbi:MAG: BON domain-containing protein [Pirellulales bacterium]
MSDVNFLTARYETAAEETTATDAAICEPRTGAAAIVLAVERAIRRDTRRGVFDLEVQVATDGVHLRGRCSTFYCKQLAQHAAATVVSRARLHNDIEVW